MVDSINKDLSLTRFVAQVYGELQTLESQHKTHRSERKHDLTDRTKTANDRSSELTLEKSAWQNRSAWVNLGITVGAIFIPNEVIQKALQSAAANFLPRIADASAGAYDGNISKWMKSSEQTARQLNDMTNTQPDSLDQRMQAIMDAALRLATSTR